MIQQRFRMHRSAEGWVIAYFPAETSAGKEDSKGDLDETMNQSATSTWPPPCSWLAATNRSWWLARGRSSNGRSSPCPSTTRYFLLTVPNRQRSWRHAKPCAHGTFVWKPQWLCLGVLLRLPPVRSIDPDPGETINTCTRLKTLPYPQPGKKTPWGGGETQPFLSRSPRRMDLTRLFMPRRTRASPTKIAYSPALLFLVFHPCPARKNCSGQRPPA